jgi:2-polyprenyl-3-methyl-5-hydroxy-6-metoxy-1,4-benzoquinol methylase
MGFEVNGLFLDDGKLRLIISEIKKNKDYENIEEGMMRKYIRKYAFNEFSRLRKDFNSLENSRFLKGCVKYVRAKLRKKSALYLTKKTREILDQINTAGKVGKGQVREVLESHRSTKERLGFYKELYSKIFSSSLLSSKPRVADIGCGLNPFSYLLIPEGRLKRTTFYAVDIDKEILDSVKLFFKSFSIKGKVFLLKALDFASSIDKKFDCVLLFRLLELVDDSGHNEAERIIRMLNADLYVASFSRRTISGNRMTLQNKPWLERMLERLGYKYDITSTKEEIFYFFYHKNLLVKASNTHNGFL